MTKTQFNKKFDELIEDLKPYIKKKSKELLDSGAIDLKSYGDDHRLPRIVLQAVLRKASVEFKTPHPLDKKEVENLLRF